MDYCSPSQDIPYGADTSVFWHVRYTVIKSIHPSISPGCILASDVFSHCFLTLSVTIFPV